MVLFFSRFTHKWAPLVGFAADNCLRSATMDCKNREHSRRTTGRHRWWWTTDWCECWDCHRSRQSTCFGARNYENAIRKRFADIEWHLLLKAFREMPIKCKFPRWQYFIAYFRSTNPEIPFITFTPPPPTRHWKHSISTYLVCAGIAIRLPLHCWPTTPALRPASKSFLFIEIVVVVLYDPELLSW